MLIDREETGGGGAAGSSFGKGRRCARARRSARWCLFDVKWPEFESHQVVLEAELVGEMTDPGRTGPENRILWSLELREESFSAPE